jgi:hypothetical protein
MAESRRIAVRRVRLAALSGIIAPGVEYGLWISHGVRHLGIVSEGAKDDPELYSDVVRKLTGILLYQGADLVAAFVLGWWLAYPLYFLVCRIIHRRVFSRVPDLEWRGACDNALWPLPWAAAGGVMTWLAYAHLFPYGWPNDIACGTIGHLLGAWCYLTVFVSWYKVVRNSEKPPVD